MKNWNCIIDYCSNHVYSDPDIFPLEWFSSLQDLKSGHLKISRNGLRMMVFLLNVFLKSRREVFNVYSDYGYELHGFLMKQENPTDRYVILTHGYSGNRWESLAYANIYYELGYHVYLYDMRYHGDNDDGEESFLLHGVL